MAQSLHRRFSLKNLLALHLLDSGLTSSWREYRPRFKTPNTKVRLNSHIFAKWGRGEGWIRCENAKLNFQCQTIQNEILFSFQFLPPVPLAGNNNLMSLEQLSTRSALNQEITSFSILTSVPPFCASSGFGKEIPSLREFFFHLYPPKRAQTNMEQSQFQPSQD